jgi:hypothetical protein
MDSVPTDSRGNIKSTYKEHWYRFVNHWNSTDTYIPPAATLQNSPFCHRHCVCVFSMSFGINTGYFPKPHWLVGLWYGDGLCSLWGMNRLYVCILYECQSCNRWRTVGIDRLPEQSWVNDSPATAGSMSATPWNGHNHSGCACRNVLYSQVSPFAAHISV